VAEQVTPEELDAGLIYPPQSSILATELHTAERVAEVIFARGLAQVPEPADLREFIRSHTYKAEYRSLV
jgi:malate dehydrogenase (oxaloacetate-decarboxylating)(NADP+)